MHGMSSLRRPIAAAALLAATCFARPARAASPPLPAPPAVTADQGRTLVQLARDAMRRFLTLRVGPADVPLSAAMKDLAGKPNIAAVTLRSGGAIVGLGTCGDFDLPHNVAAAALQAMRSPRLPDRVDRAVLDALTVEVEALSPLEPVGEAQVAHVFRPGLTGLAYGQGDSTARVLPSAAYVLDLDADQLRRSVLAGLRPARAATTQPHGLGVFTARHFLGWPDGRVVELYRGKDLARRDGLDEKRLRAGAEMVGRFLMANQLKTGRYATPAGEGTLREHARATWAMAQLARLSGAEANQPLSASVAAAVDHAATFVRRDGAAATLADERPGDRLAAAAMIALAIRQMPRPLSRTWDLRVTLLNGLVKQLLAVDSAADTRPAVTPADLFVAYLALAGVAQTDGQFTRWLADIRKALAGFELNWPTEHALAFRAGLTTVPPTRSRSFTLAQLASGALPDERGAFVLPGQQPSTVETGLTAVCLAKALRGGTTSAGVQDRAAAVASWMEARRFCYRMIYQPGEAYFASDGGAWVGGVRAAPGSARVTLGACAAAIEALLAQ